MKVPKQVEVISSRREFEMIAWCAAYMKQDLEKFIQETLMKRCKNIYLDYKEKENEKKIKEEQKKDIEKEKILSEIDIDKELITRRRYEGQGHTKRLLPEIPEQLKKDVKEVSDEDLLNIEGSSLPQELKEDEDFNRLVEEEFE